MIKRGNTWADKSLGSGLDERNPFCDEGTVEDDENSLLYDETLELHSMGERWGELYRATHRRPSENISAEVVRLVSKTKSGDV